MKNKYWQNAKNCLNNWFYDIYTYYIYIYMLFEVVCVSLSPVNLHTHLLESFILVIC